MLSRRENLLIRPWQERRYYNHRRKVILATPAIDAHPPPFWGHVCCKLKSSAKEDERISRIEQDNFRLLQRMGKIMRSSKKMIDDRWTTPQPTFLNRVGIYVPSGRVRKHLESNDEPDSQATACVTDPSTPRRHSRCSACCPVETKPRKDIPEERVPWDPPKPSISRRKTSPDRLKSHKEDPERRWGAQTAKREGITKPKSKVCYQQDIDRISQKRSFLNDFQRDDCYRNRYLQQASFQRVDRVIDISPTEQIVITCGSLTLSLEVPPESSILIRNMNKEKFIKRGYCYCKSFKLSGEQKE